MLKKGQKFKLTEDAIMNYGKRYADRTFTVTHVATRYGKPGGPEGTHPGFCHESAGPGGALYDANGLNFSVYDWEIEPA